MTKKIISNQEPKGTRDWFPEEFLIRKYIFDAWRRVCLRYGFEEYLTPLVENAEIYRAKSGEDVGGQELVTFRDLGDRELSIRPEMTPSVMRMVSKIYSATPKPLKYFSIANFMRNEKPQRGRNREFWQLNCDIFGSDSLNADLEILQLALDLMFELGAPEESFSLDINSRRLLEEIFTRAGLKDEQKVEVGRILDKWNKLSAEQLQLRLSEIGLTDKAIKILGQFMVSKSLAELASNFKGIEESSSYQEIDTVLKELSSLGFASFLRFNPAVVRGFDYYDGLIFEIFDRSPDNKRALFGGGRYNGLAEIFGSNNIPAVGFAPGDETTRLFLESWGLLEKITEERSIRYYLPLLDTKLFSLINRLARQLRSQGMKVISGLEEQKISKALDFANKKGIEKMIIVGSEEADAREYKIKDMASGQEEIIKFSL